MKPDQKISGEVDASDKNVLGPEPGTPPPAAQVSSGSEPRASDRPLPKRPRKTRIEGSKRLSCKRCDHFLGELKAAEFEFLTTCHRCKTENHFAFQAMKA